MAACDRPTVLNIPDELRVRPQWVTWKYENGTKVPYDAKTGRKASSTDPATWATYEAATAAVKRRHHAGVGYVFAADDPYTGIDLDDCIDDAGDVAPWAQTIVDAMQTYTEISPSGTGLKMWVRGTIPRSVKTAQTEIYTQSRYFTATGRQLSGTPAGIRDAQPALDTLYHELRPEPTPPAALCGPVRSPVAVDDDHARRYALAALEDEHQIMLATGDGERHNQRIKSAHALAGYIPHITEDEITVALAVNFGRDERSARKTIADGIRTGREAPREIPPSHARDGGGFHFSPEVTKETIVDNPQAERWRLEAQYWQEQAQMLEGWRDWAMAVAALPTERLSPAAKVAAFTLWPEMQSRAERGIDEPTRIYIEEARTKAGLSAGTHGSKIKELASVGAIERIEARQENGHKKVLIQPTTLWATPADWQPEAPRNHGGADRGQGRRPVLPCPVHGDEAPVIVETQIATRYLCGDCATPLGHTFGKVKRSTWRANNQVDSSVLPPVDDEANNQIAQIREDCSSPPINQLDCWVPPSHPLYIPPVARMDPTETLGVQRGSIAADDLWFALQHELVARQAMGGSS